MSNNNGEISRAQIDRLEDEKDSLILQVSVLTDQVEAQGEKIRDLEFTLEEQNIKSEELEQELESVSGSQAIALFCVTTLLHISGSSQIHSIDCWQ